LNHNKIIHFRNGYPVYSLSTPALYSKPAANFFARQMFRTIQNKNMPNIASFAVNDVCNANCEHCSFFSGVDEKSGKTLTLEEAKKLIKDIQELGVSVINFVGGEPLLREDLPEIIRSVDKDISTTIIFTNGFLLAEKAKKLKEAGLDSIYISLDSAEQKAHDLIRGTKGIFKKALDGIRIAKDLGFSVGISCCITPELFRKGEMEKIIDLGKDLGVHEVLVFDAMPCGRYKNRKDLIDNNDWVEEIIKVSEKYNSDPSYPGVLIWAYATSYRSVGCSCGTAYFYVSPYGDIMSCDFNHYKFGNIRKKPLYQIWDELSSLDVFKQAKWGGCKIKDSKYLIEKTVSPG
jgi:MoaA/NifB/PqqE/SkfB family radical SAM enzyme